VILSFPSGQSPEHAARKHPVKAIVYQSYGPPDVLRHEEIPKPSPTDDEVLIKVRAASLNPADWHLMRGTPRILRMQAGLRKPKLTRLGIDVAGEVEAAGSKVSRFKPGDAVFGSCHGAFAEYACASESKLAMKPANATFEQAASVPVAAYTALQGLRDKAHLQPGHKVLINGAAGGVGTFTVQIAKWLGADVTAVCSTRNIDMVRSLGADRVIDYTQQDFTRELQRYDAIFDCVGNHSLAACKCLLSPRGTYIMVGAPSGEWISPVPRLLAMVVWSRFVTQNMTGILAKGSLEDLQTMRELMESGKVTPVIDRQYPFSRVSDAMRYLEQGHARGKVIITVTPEA